MLRLRSCLSNVSQVQPFLEQIKSKYALCPEMYGNMLVSLTEAVTNAICHGNCEDDGKEVCVQLKARGNELAFRVSDEGDGFDYQELPDPTCPQNLTQIGGRGVFLMHELSDRVRFLNNGSTVEMCFRLQRNNAS
jgi:serine/threonine-protein kinase RsbW